MVGESMTSYGGKKHAKILEEAITALKSEGYEVVVLKGRIPDAIAYKGEISFVEAVTKGDPKMKEGAFKAYYPNVNIRVFCGEVKKVRTPKERGYRHIIVPVRLYDKLTKLKGEKSFSQFISGLIDTVSTEVSITEQHVKAEGEPKPSTSVKSEEKVEAKPSIDYRSHLCRNCGLDARGVEFCRVRQYKYVVYGLECPRQKALSEQCKPGASAF
jgi:predicted CopG family antitoxin